MGRIFVGMINLYSFFSAMFPCKCRYYPTCSQYSKMLFQTQNPLIALFYSILRILSCNQLFKGGIQYPCITRKQMPSFSAVYPYATNPKDIAVDFWLTPCLTPHKYYLLKAFCV